MTKAVEFAFTEFLRSKAAEAKSEVKYNPTQFLSMLEADGGYQTVVKLVSKPQPSDGFTKLWERSRLDLSVEALILESKWSIYFDDSLLTLARKRLSNVGYVPTEAPFDDDHSRAIAENDESAKLPTEVLSRVTAEHIWNAIQNLVAGTVSKIFSESINFDLITDDGKRLDPKAVFGLALSEVLQDGSIGPKHFSADETSPCFRILREAGYKIVPKDQALTLDIDLDIDPDEWREGEVRLTTHRRKERASGLARAKKAQYKRIHGKLTCEECRLDPIAHYGSEIGEACIEVHHARILVADMPPSHQTTLDDLQCLCANCHRLVHRKLRMTITPG